MAKSRLNLSLDPDLVEFAKEFAEDNRTTVANVFTQYLLALKRRRDGDPMELILSHPDFEASLRDVQERMQTGEASWHSFDEIFN
jgi:hypothetical protein